ncbi:hypothetical protein LTR29_010423 [Friedmanniomyces endolithicus]|nr:hypothetical protein LTR29_010423 [Friedmanniomyces endolithicus]
MAMRYERGGIFGLTISSVISRHQRAQLSYDELDRKSNALARGLQGIGVKKGDRVAVSLGNSVEFAISTYALFKLGAILNPLNPSFNAQQVVSATKHLDTSHLIIGAETNLSRKPPRNNVQLLEHLAPGLRGGMLESESVPSLKEIVLVDNSSGRVDAAELKATVPFEAILAGSGRTLPDQGLHKDDVVNIQYTSGTTSTPKAACLSHRSILNNGMQIGDRMLLTPSDIVCCPPPLFHCFGCILGYMATATHGSAIVFPTEAFDPLATLKAVQEYKATALYGVATMFLAELELLADGTVPYEGFQHLRTGIAAGSSVPAELMRKLHRILNLHDLTICYGMTETSPERHDEYPRSDPEAHRNRRTPDAARRGQSGGCAGPHEDPRSARARRAGRIGVPAHERVLGRPGENGRGDDRGPRGAGESVDVDRG